MIEQVVTDKPKKTYQQINLDQVDKNGFDSYVMADGYGNIYKLISHPDKDDEAYLWLDLEGTSYWEEERACTPRVFKSIEEALKWAVEQEEYEVYTCSGYEELAELIKNLSID